MKNLNKLAALGIAGTLALSLSKAWQHLRLRRAQAAPLPHPQHRKAKAAARSIAHWTRSSPAVRSTFEDVHAEKAAASAGL